MCLATQPNFLVLGVRNDEGVGRGIGFGFGQLGIE
jgi:hypothetical protein